MSASSSTASSAVPQIKYDVFLNFSGTDTRRGFLSHLCKALSQKKIEAYVDDRLERGHEISAALLRAIEQSEISLVMFSRSYASSRWCLEELVKITDCMQRNGQIVLPVFYNIDPSEVRNQKGIYGDALAEHEKKFKQNMDEVQNWRSVLKKVANLSGFHSSNFRTEAELIEKLVDHVLIRLNHMYQSDLKGLIGIHEKISHVELLLCGGSEDVRIVGIWGMGGIGKTTIAGALFNRLCSDFEACCFLANVREESEKCGIANLCDKVLSTLLEEHDLHVALPNSIPAYVMRRLRRKKVLLVLDDVNDSEQLRDLCGGHDWFGLGSRIIVTTRNKHVLVREANYIYEVKELDFGESLQLFNLNAFKQSCPGKEYSDLSNRAVNYGKGNPLALKVLGSFLYGKNKKEWESELEKLKKLPCIKIQNVLRWSYNGLDREERNIFLHIACFFKGDTKEHIEVLLDACGYSTTIGLKTLQDKALIMAFENCVSGICVSMHDLIQEMGWEIVREESIKDPGRRSRLWDPNDIYQVLKNKTGTEAIESINLDMFKIEDLQLHPQAFARMSKLKFLKFYNGGQSNVYLPEGLESLSEELRLFFWSNYPSKYLPLKFCTENLVELIMPNSNVERLWDGVQNLVNLKIMYLISSEHLLELPDLSKASSLGHVILSGCTSLRHVHPSLLSLHTLIELNLTNCEALTSLQSNIHLRSLGRLILDSCSSLKEFSVTSEAMTLLDLTHTAITELPSSIGCLNKLEMLFFRSCESLKTLASCLSGLGFLNYLDFCGCRQLEKLALQSLFDGLQSFSGYLLMENCSNLFELPDNINRLSSLDHLILNGSNIETLPTTIKHLSQLIYLDLSDCKRLRSLPELPPSIEYLDATDCTSLEMVLGSTAEVQKECKRPLGYKSFMFNNCMKLNGDAINTIKADAHARIKLAAFSYLTAIEDVYYLAVCLPGNKVPDWFSYRTEQNSITIELSPNSKLAAFAFCITLAAFQLSRGEDIMDVGCLCYFEASKGERVENTHSRFAKHPLLFRADHLYIWCEEECYIGIMNAVKEIRASDGCTNNNSRISFEFYVETTAYKGDKLIKECGVYPIYALDYLNVDEQQGTKYKKCQDANESECSKIGIGCGSSYGNKDDQEHLPQKQKLIFPALPNGTWKQSGTKGLKEILFL